MRGKTRFTKFFGHSSFQIILIVSFLSALSLACDRDEAKPLQERLIENKWENTGFTTIKGVPISEEYTGVYNFSPGGTYTQTINDSIILGKWELQGDTAVVFDKEDFFKRRFWHKIDIADDYLRLVPKLCLPPYQCRAYNISGYDTSYIELYIPVQ